MAPGRSLTAALKKTNILSTEGYMCDMSMLASSGLKKREKEKRWWWGVLPYQITSVTITQFKG